MITPEVLAGIPFFAPLSQQELGDLSLQAADVQVQAGEWLIREGEKPAFFVVLAGRLTLYKTIVGVEQQILQYGPGDFFGEVPLLLGSPAIASVKAAVPSRIVRLEEGGFRELIADKSPLIRVILDTMADRVARLQKINLETPVPHVTVIGARWDLQCHNLRQFLARNHVVSHWLEPEAAVRDKKVSADAARGCPLVMLEDGTVLTAPGYRELADRVHLRTQPEQTSYDVVMVGAGPAGLAAGVYGASEGLSTLLIEKEAPGGQAGTSSRIANYLGFPAGLSGDELSTRAYRQAVGFGADIVVARRVTEVVPGWRGARHRVLLDGGDSIECRALVLSMGVAWRRFKVAPVDDLVGRGVYYGASPTDSLLTRGKDVYMVGAGNSAGQAAVHLANYARKVTLIVRGASLNTSMSQYLIDEIGRKANITVETDSEVVGADGTTHLEAIEVRNNSTGAVSRRVTDTLFILIGADPETQWLPADIRRDADGYVTTGRDLMEDLGGVQSWPLVRDPFLLESSVPGIFAAGDVRQGSMKRVASGVGEGSMAIAFIHRYLDTDPTHNQHLEKSAALASLGRVVHAARGI